MSSFPITRLPVEVLDDIASLAIALGIISVKDATLVCPRWKLRYQQLLFESVKVDPFSSNLPDLEKRAHLAPYIKVLRITHRSGSSAIPDHKHDPAELFTKFLLHAGKVERMLFLDARIQWENVSPKTIDAFRAVFERPSFRSLEISVCTPLPSWMLLHGTSIASDLTVHYVGSIVPPPESTELISYQCSLTRLVLFDNSSVKQIAVFCLSHRNLAMDLLRNVVHAVLEYGEVDASQGPSITPYAEILVAFLAPQLEVLELRVGSSRKASFLFERSLLTGIFQPCHHPISQIQQLQISKLCDVLASLWRGVLQDTVTPWHLRKNICAPSSLVYHPLVSSSHFH
jgi:hypothetical protein